MDSQVLSFISHLENICVHSDRQIHAKQANIHISASFASILLSLLLAVVGRVNSLHIP